MLKCGCENTESEKAICASCQRLVKCNKREISHKKEKKKLFFLRRQKLLIHHLSPQGAPSFSSRQDIVRSSREGFILLVVPPRVSKCQQTNPPIRHNTIVLLFAFCKICKTQSPIQNLKMGEKATNNIFYMTNNTTKPWGNAQKPAQFHGAWSHLVW